LPNERYAKLLRKLILACPKTMRAVAILSDGENQGTIGSCCDKCTAAMIHDAADVLPDPRGPEELEREGQPVH
jgi:hypothetical protein